MFAIRTAQAKDLDDLYSLAKQTFFINLPPDREIIANKIDQSLASFARLAGSGTAKAAAKRAHDNKPAAKSTSHRASGLKAITGHSDLFLVVLENLETRTVIGTSQIIAHMGSPDSPRHFMALQHLTTNSKSLGLGWSHLVGTMGSDPTGPTEIGGLILNHAFRGHPLRLGRFLSFARFHLIGLHRKVFADTIVAEMLGPITRTGYNPFYEKFTRHFITRPFNDVYRFSQTSREFLDTLMPRGDIFLSILDPEVANAAGEVSDDTRPARKLLERLGFEYHHRIDPLDGGPHLEAKTGSISIVRDTKRVNAFTALNIRTRLASRASRTRAQHAEPDAIASTLQRDGVFRALQCRGSLTGKSAAIEPIALEDLPESGVVSRGFTPLKH
jgi:arginine N-succinyltransferase